MFTNLFSTLLKTKLVFTLPSKKKILIYDNNNFNYFKKFLNNFDHEILYTRKEIINLPILVISLFKNFLSKIGYNYKYQYIKYVNPKIIITMTDNDLDFLRYKFKDKKKIAIQNAYRKDNFPDIFSYNKYEKKNEYNLDYIFCFNNSIGELYKRSFGAKPIVTGSLKNNLIKKVKIKDKKTIGYISQFRMRMVNEKYMFPYTDFIKNLNFSTFKKKNYNNITTKEFYEKDEKVIKYVLKYLLKKNITLNIIGVMKKNQEIEKRYYENICKGYKFNFIKNNSYGNSYKIIDEYKIIIGLDSTMLYESLARKITVAFFSVRRSSFKNYNSFFGFPYNKKAKGFFWTSSANYLEVSRVLDNLFNLKKSHYKNKVKSYLSNLTYFDTNNKKFSSELKNIFKREI